MALDFSKLTAAVQAVAELAASHAHLSTNLSTIAQDAKDIEAKVTAKVKAEFDGTIAALEAKAQSELDSIVAALEAALSSPKPLTQAEAVGVTAVATALSDAISPTQPAAPVAPVPPAQPEAAPSAPVVASDAAPAVVAGVAPAPVAPPVPKTVDEYNAMRAAGLLP